MRRSRPMPSATFLMSAPAASARCDSSFIKLMRVASMALAAYLISSALLMSVKTIGRSARTSGW